MAFSVMSFHAGGTGARPGTDGLLGHRLPERRAQRADRGQRGGVADRRLEEGVSPGPWRRGRIPRRPGAGDGSRHHRHRAVGRSAPTTIASSIRRAAESGGHNGMAGRGISRVRPALPRQGRSRPCRRTTASSSHRRAAADAAIRASATIAAVARRRAARFHLVRGGDYARAVKTTVGRWLNGRSSSGSVEWAPRERERHCCAQGPRLRLGIRRDD